MDFVDMLEVSQETKIRQVGSSLHHPLIMNKPAVFQDKTCPEINAEGWISMDMKHSAYIVIFAMFSMACTGFVALMMRNNKQLMSHPNKLIFYMCICEGIIAW